MSRRRSYILLFSAVFVTVVVSCQHATENVMRFGLSAAPVTLDPRYATDATSARINRLLYQRLVDFDEHALPIPAIADWQQVSALHYRFQLNDAVRPFHNGAPVTTADVKATYDYVLDPKNASPQRAALTLIDKIETPTAATIDFYLTHPDPMFPGYLVLGILPAALIAANHPFNQYPIGSGPYSFIAWPEEGRLQLQRRRDAQMLEFIRVADTTVRVLKLVRHEIDMLQNDLSPELIRYLGRQQGIVVQKGKGTNFTYLGINLQDAQLAKPPIREAIAYAIDRSAIIRYVFDGAARPASALLPPDHWAGVKELKGYDYDPARARRLLDDLGFNAQNPLRLTYKTSSDPFRIRVATILQSQLAAVGIQVDLRTYDWGTFYADIKAGNFQLYSLSWVGIHTPDIFRYVFHSTSLPPEGANRGRYQDEQVDHLLDEAQTALSLAQQAQAFQAVQRRVLETLPYIPLWYEDHIFIANQNITGYRVNVEGNYDGLVTAVKR